MSSSHSPTENSVGSAPLALAVAIPNTRVERMIELAAVCGRKNLALRIFEEDMVGREVGGLLDEQIKTLLRLERTGAQVALGYACGLPTSIPGRRIPHD